MRRLPLLLQAWREPARLAALDAAGWDLLLRQADSANLGAALYYLAEEQGLLAALPAPVRVRMDWARVAAERHRQAVRWELNRISLALAPTGLPLLLLKGAAYVAAGLPCGQGRMFSDVDILVPKARIGAVELQLMQHGWSITGYDEYDQRYYREWMHELPPMTHVRRDSTIDVHHAILPETAAAHPDTEKLRAAARALPGHAGMQVLAPADMVLHSAVHLFSDGEFEHGARDLIDIHRLLEQFGRQPGFWAALVPRAAELQLTRPLFYALRHAVRLLGTPVPAATLAASAAGGPNRLLLALMDQLFGRALLPPHASCNDWATAAARFLLYLRGNWLRMPPLLLARHLFRKAFMSPKPTPPA